MKKEVFKKIGFKEISVSNLGRVKNEKTGNILKTFLNSCGYLQVNLGIDESGKQYVPLIHKLVAEAFIPNTNNYPIINHKDEDKTNNDSDNLEWCDYMYNINYGTCIARKSSALKGNKNAAGAKHKKGSVPRYIYIYNGKEYNLKDLCDELQCSKSKITESFRRDLGLVRSGELTRRIKTEEEEALDIGYRITMPRELTEEEVEWLDSVFNENGGKQ